MASGPIDAELSEGDNEFVVQAPKAKFEDTEMDITPMIDITFLLLIFFLVASKIDESPPIKLPGAEYASVVPVNNSIFITVASGSAEMAAVFKGSGRSPENAITASNPAEQEEEVAKYVQEMLDNDLRQQLHHIVIMAEGNVKTGEVSRIAKAAGNAAEKPMHVAVMEGGGE